MALITQYVIRRAAIWTGGLLPLLFLPHPLYLVVSLNSYIRTTHRRTIKVTMVSGLAMRNLELDRILGSPSEIRYSATYVKSNMVTPAFTVRTRCILCRNDIAIY